MPPPLQLAEITLCCVDTRNPDLALHALQHSMEQVKFARALLIGPKDWKNPHDRDSTIEYIGIDCLNGISEYSNFMLSRLAPYIHTTHVLIIQWDGFVTNPRMWRNDFLKYDYIGAPWYHRPQPVMVGNGGFSLRSKRLLDALSALPTPAEEPEDSAICIYLRDQLQDAHGIVFAPLNVAQAFSCEYGGWREAFGFHGMHNFAHVMNKVELSTWLSRVPTDLLLSQHTRNLIKELMRSGRTSEAKLLVFRRSQMIGWTNDQCMLLMRTIAYHIWGKYANRS